MKDTQTSTFLFKGADEKDAFFIRLEFEPELNGYFLSTSFIIDLNKYFKYDSLAGDVTCQKRKDDMIPKINKIAEVILSIPELRQFYLPEFLLTKEGRFSAETALTLMHMMDGKTTFPEYTLFSERINPVYFYEFRMALLTCVVNMEFGEISKNNWEKVISNSDEIQLEYVEQYSDSNHFLLTKGKGGFGNAVDYYMLLNNGELKFFFTCKSPK